VNQGYSEHSSRVFDDLFTRRIYSPGVARRHRSSADGVSGDRASGVIGCRADDLFVPGVTSRELAEPGDMK
jgi:hypothetical protein